MRLKDKTILAPDTTYDLAPYKEPLTPVEKGFGFYGTLTQNKEHTHVQCHICGYFFASLSQHAYMVHGLRAKEYRQEYGLARKTSLISDKMKVKLAAIQINQPTAVKTRRLENFKKARTKSAANKGDSHHRKSLEQKNREGRCYYQLLDKIEVLGKELKRTPTKRDFQARYGDGMLSSIYHTFGSWNQALSFAGFTPNQYRQGRPKYDRETVIAMIRNFYEIEGRVPRSRDLGNMLPATHVMGKLFGGLIEARKAAGFGQADYIHEREEYVI